MFNLQYPVQLQKVEKVSGFHCAFVPSASTRAANFFFQFRIQKPRMERFLSSLSSLMHLLLAVIR